MTEREDTDLNAMGTKRPNLKDNEEEDETFWESFKTTLGLMFSKRFSLFIM